MVKAMKKLVIKDQHNIKNYYIKQKKNKTNLINEWKIENFQVKKYG